MSSNPEHRAYFVDVVVRAIRLSRPAQLVVVEGYLLAAIADEVAKAMGMTSDAGPWAGRSTDAEDPD